MGEITNFTTKLDVLTKKLKDGAEAAGLPIPNLTGDGGVAPLPAPTDGAGSFKYNRISPFNQNMPGPKPLDNGMFYDLNAIYPKESNYDKLVQLEIHHKIIDKSGIPRPMTEQERLELSLKDSHTSKKVGIRALEG